MQASNRKATKKSTAAQRFHSFMFRGNIKHRCRNMVVKKAWLNVRPWAILTGSNKQKYTKHGWICVADHEPFWLAQTSALSVKLLQKEHSDRSCVLTCCIDGRSYSWDRACGETMFNRKHTNEASVRHRYRPARGNVILVVWCTRRWMMEDATGETRWMMGDTKRRHFPFLVKTAVQRLLFDWRQEETVRVDV